MRLQDRIKAIKLRKQGYTYSQIIKRISNLSKSTLSGWMKKIQLTERQKIKIFSQIKKARRKAALKGSWANREKAIKRISLLQSKAEKEFPKLIQNPLFLIGLTLYWAEGSRTNRCFQFINSDPQIIYVMMTWLRKIGKIKNDDIRIRIYIHKIYKNQKCESFWSEVIKIPKRKFLKTIYKPTPHTIKRNPNYKGCCRIDVNGSELFWKVLKWEELIYKKFK